CQLPSLAAKANKPSCLRTVIRVCLAKQSSHSQQAPISAEQLLANGPTIVPDLLKNAAYSNRLTIYKYKYILPVNLVSSFKVVQTGSVLLLCTGNGVAWLCGFDTTSAFTYLLSLSLLSLGVLAYASLLLRRIVGELSIDGRNSNIVYLAHVSFWGRRRNLAVHRDHLVFTEESGHFSTLEVSGNSFPFYLSLRPSAVRSCIPDQLEQLLKPELRVAQLLKEAANKQRHQKRQGQ
ncbi:hypothetical protein BOX15_Mlig025262g1, partial [Macrostomum lignano]